MKVCALWLSASVLTVAWCGVADAQTASPAQGAAQTAPAPDTAPASSADQDISNEPEIVVTAQRRSENLQTTPISASVLSGTDLGKKGIVAVDQLQFNIPSVTVNNFGQGLEFNIRGIGKAEYNTQTTTGVITYRDGVATFPGYFQEEPYYDIANIQILRGPQGTIAGQNSTGGAVFVNTNDPIINGGFHGYLQGQYGNYNDGGLQGAINIPISNTLAARVAFFGERRDSFYHITGPDGARYNGNPGNLGEIAGRFSLIWKPSDRLTITSKTDLDYLDMGAYPADPYTNRFKTVPGTNTPNPNFTDPFNITANSPQGARDKFVRTSLKIDYDLGAGIKLRSVTGFQNGNTMYRSDLDGTATGNSTFFDSVSETSVSQEINLISPDTGRFTWLVGGYAQWDSYFFLSPYQFFIGTPAGDPATEYKLEGRNPERSLAAFGQVGFKVTPSLKLELGGRYTDSHSTNHVRVIQFGTLLPDDQSVSSTNFSYKASLGWTIDHDNFLYGFAASGFRTGGLNTPVGLGLPAPFEPETVTSYEAGWKSNFFGGHLRTTIDGFYNDYNNFQVSIGYPQFPTFSIELNVPETTRIYGFEFETQAKFGGFSFGGGISLLHSDLGQFYATDPRVPSTLPCDPRTGPTSITCINLKGRDQTYAPNFTFNVSAEYDWKLNNGDTITPRANFGHVAAQWATLFQTPELGDRLGDRNILGAQLGWNHKSWTFTLYGTNLTDQHYIGALNSNLDFAGPPRQYGIKILKLF